MLGDSLRRRHAPKKPEEPAGPRPPRPRRGLALGLDRLEWWHWVLLAVGVPLISFGIGYLAASQLLFPAPETAGAGIAVPELYDRPAAEAERLVREAGLELGPAATLTSAETPEGRVLAQDPIPGQQLRPGAEVRLVVSAGPPSPIVPSVVGLGQRAAQELLETVGFGVEVQQAPGPQPAGTILRTEPAAGTRARLPATVTLIVSVGPPQEEVPETTAVRGDPWR